MHAAVQSCWIGTRTSVLCRARAVPCRSEREAAPAGRLRFDDVLPAVGDWVAARVVDPALAFIEAVLPRSTQFSRRAPGSSVAEQVLAANIDLALVVCALDHDFNLRRIERYLVLAAESGALAGAGGDVTAGPMNWAVAVMLHRHNSPAPMKQ